MDDQSARLLGIGEAAAQKGHKAKARRAFRDLLHHEPTNLAALLWMAWLSDNPQASRAYAERALALDPDNDQALAALQWAKSRIRLSRSSKGGSDKPRRVSVSERWRRFIPLVALGSVLAFVAGMALVILWYSPQELSVGLALAATPCPTPTVTSLSASPSATATSTMTPTGTATPTRTRTPTPTPTPTQTSTPTPTPNPSDTPTPQPTATPRVTEPPPSPTPEDLSPANSSLGGNVRWIDVDLSRQTLTAYAGRTPVRSTLVSTGLPGTPTPVGKYHIYVKFIRDDMSGPDYYLPDVPYTMYFYRGYGIHGTYWHSNFGHPMSHGCINLPTEEAQWLFHWASVGTLVYIHW